MQSPYLSSLANIPGKQQGVFPVGVSSKCSVDAVRLPQESTISTLQVQPQVPAGCVQVRVSSIEVVLLQALDHLRDSVWDVLPESPIVVPTP
jgi:hypothetical protein